jgi:hypothetical protein
VFFRPNADIPFRPPRQYISEVPCLSGQGDRCEIAGIAGCWSGFAFCAALTMNELKTLPRPTVEARLASEPWVSDYLYASRLYSESSKDDAVFWYYVGQLRGHIYFVAHPGEQESQETFSTMTTVMGESINFYASTDPIKFAYTINRVLAWDAANDDPQTPKSEFQAQRDQVRQGLTGLHDEILLHADEIRAAHKSHPQMTDKTNTTSVSGKAAADVFHDLKVVAISGAVIDKYAFRR